MRFPCHPKAIMKLRKHFLRVIVALLISSCGQHTGSRQEYQEISSADKKVIAEFQSILDSANVTGCILVLDPQQGIAYSNDFQACNEGHLPASTFKIPNSIIALETGVVENDSTLFKWNGEKRRSPAWERDLIFRDAFRVSCVPCYQETARRIGTARMREYLDKLDYGEMTVDSSTIDLFWLEGESKITPVQQVDFLCRFYFSRLPISQRTETIMKRVMLIEKTDTYTLSGKTGWAIRNGNNNGWFVGYLESSNKVYFFATNIYPQVEFNMDLFPIIRAQITMEALKRLNII
jgi:beta-lactamase class D